MAMAVFFGCFAVLKFVQPGFAAIEALEGLAAIVACVALVARK